MPNVRMFRFYSLFKFEKSLHSSYGKAIWRIASVSNLLENFEALPRKWTLYKWSEWSMFVSSGNWHYWSRCSKVESTRLSKIYRIIWNFSLNYVKNVNEYIESLDQAVWNNGRNHLIYNFYHGTFPDYDDHNLNFNTGEAIIARASSSENVIK